MRPLRDNGLVFRKIAHRLKPTGAFAAGEAALNRGDYEAAASAFEDALRDDPTWTNTWFNLGLAHKFQRNWQASMNANRRAAELDPKNDAAFWNCGVAATALRDWGTARWAWQGIGIEPGPGAGPPELDLGPSPVRITSDDGGEVVWGRRIDPCRIRIDNVPTPESGHGWHDVVLHDVVPNGERRAWGRTWAVFDELLLMEPSGEPTFEAQVSVPTEADELDLHERFSAAGLGIDDWSAIRWLCKRCSESSVHDHASDADGAVTRLVQRRFGLAGPFLEVQKVLAMWSGEGRGRSFGSIVEVRS